MTERASKDQPLTTADIARRERAGESGSPAVQPRGAGERTERPADDRTGAPAPRGPAERTEHLTAVPTGAQRVETAEAHPGAPAPHDSEEPAQAGPLFSSDEARGLLSQWNSIQTGFVDEPRKAVEHADTLVATTVKRLAEMFADERSRLEGQWSRGDQVSTEELRIALRRYRSFFTRLLSV